jgi:glycogen debranching enzyme
VLPELPHGLALNELCIQTVISRCLGPLDEWGPRLAVASQCDYNALHFTPLEVLNRFLP